VLQAFKTLRKCGLISRNALVSTCCNIYFAQGCALDYSLLLMEQAAQAANQKRQRSSNGEEAPSTSVTMLQCQALASNHPTQTFWRVSAIAHTLTVPVEMQTCLRGSG
jgi:hypothetical protein